MNIIQTFKSIFKTAPIKPTEDIKTLEYAKNPYLKRYAKSNPTICRLNELKDQCHNIASKISNSKQMEELNSIEKEIDKKLKTEHSGKTGEEKTFYQLQTFDNDKFILCDMYFHDNINDVNAQIDLILITNKYIYLIEVKHLNAWKNHDICFEFKNNTLIAHHEQNKKWKGAPISWDKDPIEQSNRHKRILSNIIKNNPTLNKYTCRLYNIVVLSSNSQNRLHPEKEVIEQIVLVDKLAENIKIKDKNSNNKSLSLSEMYKIGLELLKLSSHNPKIYTKDIEHKLNNFNIKPLNDDELKEALKKYRDFQLKTTGYSPLGVFTLPSIDEIVLNRPKTISELKKIKGFGDRNTPKYGNDILEIINGNIPDYEKSF